MNGRLEVLVLLCLVMCGCSGLRSDEIPLPDDSLRNLTTGGIIVPVPGSGPGGTSWELVVDGERPTQVSLVISAAGARHVISWTDRGTVLEIDGMGHVGESWFFDEGVECGEVRLRPVEKPRRPSVRLR